MVNRLFNKWGKDVLIFISAAGLGLLSIIIPFLLNHRTKYYDSPLFPLIRSGIENLSFSGLIGLFLSGMVLGYLVPKSPWRWGVGTMTLFPIFAFAEMIADPYSHNLWPIEFIIYGLMTIPGIIGAYIGAFIKHKRDSGKEG